jgi:altronate hydrolase
METRDLNPVGSAPIGVAPLHQLAVRLHPNDNVAIAKQDLLPHTMLGLGSEKYPHTLVRVRQRIPSGHKIALWEIAVGEPVRRYAQVIGFATRPILPGEHVHTHNLGVRELSRKHAFGADAQPIEFVPVRDRRTFLGYKRMDGRVGTRNYVAVISTVGCSAHACREIARQFTPERLESFPNVDGVIALTHPFGCSISAGGPDHVLLARTLAGMARNPNVGGAIVVGLGCETTQSTDVLKNFGSGAELPFVLMIQEVGGIQKTVEAGALAVRDLLLKVNAMGRTPQPISELTLALQCGGSDGWSGVTANPVVGLVADAVVRQGGTVVLAETPEIYGVEDTLTRRAVSPEVGQKLVAKVHWWEEHTRRLGVEINNNPSPGNKAGGLTTIYEKALGAIAKAGSTPLVDVYDYAAPVTARGLVFMDSPGTDNVSVTGQVAGGCNLVLFTTGRGSVFGFKPAPSIKIVSNSATYERIVDDMDVNAGQVLEGVSIEQVVAELLDLVVAVASGQPSKSEAQGVGEAEFSPWNLGGTL